ncbi:hypothetical protein OG948_43345 (plasmid) [Embleya sp. NBC_00888]|uniref:hypothetical protein n=1 Tax=Embleya sp. NBC_00888 TaxID=2975960 RepID=UPI002F916A69|nr:hypothetical protein OG948_43345 [Embleya sp. NBC_00888]
MGRPDTGAVQMGVRMRDADDRLPLPERGLVLTPLSIGITVVGPIVFPGETAALRFRFGPLMVGAFVPAALPMAAWGLAYRERVHPERSWFTGLLWSVLLWLHTYHLFVVAGRTAVRLALGRNGWAKTRRNAEIGIAGAPTALEA